MVCLYNCSFVSLSLSGFFKVKIDQSRKNLTMFLKYTVLFNVFKIVIVSYITFIQGHAKTAIV